MNIKLNHAVRGISYGMISYKLSSDQKETFAYIVDKKNI